jgi:glycogen operon protein
MAVRKDFRTVGPFKIERGKPLPFGALPLRNGINFSLFSKHATAATLVLFKPGASKPMAEIPLDEHCNRTGHMWHLFVHPLDLNIHYGWRLKGPHDPEKGYWFDPDIILIDPYAKGLSGGAVWGQPDIYHEKGAEGEKIYHHRLGCLPVEDFDWEGDAPLRTPLEDTIIYELHVRGFTVHPSSGVRQPGTYLGLTEKIPYLQELGITAIELMPVFEFDENEHLRHHPHTGELLRNFWGYSPIAFMAPKASYAFDGRDGNQVNEFRQMVKAFHRAGIEVYLDVVFNHTGEGDERGPTVSFRGIDNRVYYMLDEQGRYRNFSGCGNTLNCNHPLVRDMIIDCLHYWVAEMHIDGFRFDLASILGRGPDGEVLQNPPLLEHIALDPVLADTKIIAEAWDAAGLYQVGSFPAWGRWAEWNGFYRDQVRLFWKGKKGIVSQLASRICGSEDLYSPSGRRPYHSINFVTAHDGFTLHDLVSYNKKHNEDNGEENRDGENNNNSMNFGVEGPAEKHTVNRKRRQHMKNFIATLLLSQGVPMILAGDEFRRTQQGNNNPYCQDNEICWVNWELVDQHADMLRFTRLMIAFRQQHHSLRREHFFGYGPGIRWLGEKVDEPDWSGRARWLAFLLEGHKAPEVADNDIIVMLNASNQVKHFAVPKGDNNWRRVIDTARPSPEDIFENEDEAPTNGHHHERYEVSPRSVVVLVS